MKINRFIVYLIVVVVSSTAFMCDKDVQPITPKIGITTILPDNSKYAIIYYISDLDDESGPGDGTKEKPWTSVNYALEQVSGASAEKPYALFISAGNYSENTLQLKPFVDLYGGFNEKDWKRDIERYKTVLNGNEKRRVLLGADNCRVDGFYILDGVIRGQGAAILCDAVTMHISNNVFTLNKTLGPENWNPKFMHETANDGGAVYCTNGANVTLENNHFLKNYAENGRGAALACDYQCTMIVRNNVFYANDAGLSDPMRSSDGGAISIFRWSNAIIENNIVLSNRALSKNDAGGIFVALWSSAEINGNIIVDNVAGDDAGGIFVGGQEHRYDAPLDPLPPADSFFVTIDGNTIIGNRNSSMNSGAMRFTMESRGKFLNNVVAHNNGIYFQRSEVEVSENIILDDMLFIETKAGLKPGVIHDNIIWANLTVDTEVAIENNNFINDTIGGSNYHKDFSFRDDMTRLKVISSVYRPRAYFSTLTIIGDNLEPGILRNRVVKTGRRWSVVIDNDANTLRLWGNFSAETEITILPTYTVKN